MHNRSISSKITILILMTVCIMRDTRIMYYSQSLLSLYPALSSILWRRSTAPHWLTPQSSHPPESRVVHHMFQCTTIYFDVCSVTILIERYSQSMQLSSFALVWFWGHRLFFIFATHGWADAWLVSIVLFDRWANFTLIPFSGIAIPA